MFNSIHTYRTPIVCPMSYSFSIVEQPCYYFNYLFFIPSHLLFLHNPQQAQRSLVYLETTVWKPAPLSIGFIFDYILYDLVISLEYYS